MKNRISKIDKGKELIVLRLNNVLDRKLLRNIDFTIIITTILLVVYGVIAIASATHVMENGINKNVKVQIAAFFIGIIAILIVLLIDYKNYGDFQKTIYVINIILLLSLFVVGIKVKGSRSWIDLGPVNFQPSEVVKIGFILCFAKFLEKRKNKLNHILEVLPCLLYISVPIILIQLQPDTGTMLVFVFISAIMLFVAGLNYKYIIVAIGTFIASAPALWFFVLKPHQKSRIMVFLHPELDQMGAGYNVLQSMRAIGSGKLLGKGLFKGTMNNLNYVPESRTDFIYSVIGEELGLVGATILILLFLLLLLRCIHIAKVSKDDYGMLICTGIMAMYLFHVLQNIGMTIGVLPVTGIPLPFISYGGSALVTNMVAIGLVLNVGMRRQLIRF